MITEAAERGVFAYVILNGRPRGPRERARHHAPPLRGVHQPAGSVRQASADRAGEGHPDGAQRNRRSGGLRAAQAPVPDHRSQARRHRQAVTQSYLLIRPAHDEQQPPRPSVRIFACARRSAAPKCLIRHPRVKDLSSGPLEGVCDAAARRSNTRRFGIKNPKCTWCRLVASSRPLSTPTVAALAPLRHAFAAWLYPSATSGERFARCPRSSRPMKQSPTRSSTSGTADRIRVRADVDAGLAHHRDLGRRAWRSRRSAALERGRGLNLDRSRVSDATIQTDAGGTTVRLHQLRSSSSASGAVRIARTGAPRRALRRRPGD